MVRFPLFFGIFCLLAVTLAAAQTGEKGYFIIRLGHDTTAVEEFSWDGHELHGTSVTRVPRTTIREYSATFNAGGSLEHFKITAKRFNGALVSDRDFVYSDDSVRVTNKQDTTTSISAVAAKGRPYPFVLDIYGGWQAMLQHALAGNQTQFSMLSGKRLLNYTIGTPSDNTFDLVNTNDDYGPIHVTKGEGGQLAKFDLTATTDKIVVERISAADLTSLAREFDARDRAGHALGILSPRDTAQAEIDGAHLLVDYGRPAVRGRTIFGKVVPWDSVWRTGANAATQLVTDKELRFGSTAVPAGTYSLFTVPSADRWVLIINKQHGQWGTQYDPSKDLARVPLEVSHQDKLTERFEFNITPQAKGGVLRFRWEYTEASIPFEVP